MVMLFTKVYDLYHMLFYLSRVSSSLSKLCPHNIIRTLNLILSNIKQFDSKSKNHSSLPLSFSLPQSRKKTAHALSI